MEGLKQPKRVSWAPDLSLRQIRLFLTEDAPSQSRFGVDDHLQAKGSWLRHASDMGSDDSLPPGFEMPSRAANQFKVDISQIPLVNWHCPLKLLLNPEWLVVAGEESQEVIVQNQRQRSVLEAIYPRSSSIPPNPSVSAEVEDVHHDDFGTPFIPITAIEDDDTLEQTDTMASMDTPAQLPKVDALKSLPEDAPPSILSDARYRTEKLQPSAVSLPPDFPHSGGPTIRPASGAEPDVMLAASAAFTAMMRSNEKGSLVDRDLLIKILSEPSMIEKLMSECGAPKQTPPPLAPASAPPLMRPLQMDVATLPSLPTMQSYPVNNVVRPPLNPQAPPPMQFNTTEPPATRALPMKDVNYFKSLIKQHGEDRQELPVPRPVYGQYHDNPNKLMGVNGVDIMGHGSKHREAKPKILKPCIYFNTSRGCRHGANCMYQHDEAYTHRIDQEKSSKRIKLDNGIAGRN